MTITQERPDVIIAPTGIGSQSELVDALLNMSTVLTSRMEAIEQAHALLAFLRVAIFDTLWRKELVTGAGFDSCEAFYEGITAAIDRPMTRLPAPALRALITIMAIPSTTRACCGERYHFPDVVWLAVLGSQALERDSNQSPGYRIAKPWPARLRLYRA